MARSALFRIERLQLEFSNGEQRTYERLPAGGREAVIIVAIDANGELLLIREYASGFHEHQLSLPKGTAEPGEDLLQAANRELKEEIGFGARQLTFLKRLSIAPSHMGFTINVVLATDLYPEKLPGDEPEPLELVRYPSAAVPQLIAGEEFSEARSIAALMIALDAHRLEKDAHK